MKLKGMDKMVQFEELDFEELISAKNLIAKGSTRDVYRVGRFVLKKHKHQLGYKQSLNEEAIYISVPEKEWRGYLAKPHYVSKDYSLFDYVEPLETNPLDGCDIRCSDLDASDEKYGLAIQNIQENSELGLVSWLEDVHELMIEDLYMSQNLGIDKSRTNFVFLDYGLDKTLALKHDEATLKGEIPYQVVEVCPYCKGDAIFEIKGSEETLISCQKCNY